MTRSLRATGPLPQANCEEDCAGEQGFMLLGLIVAMFIILLVLGAAATKVAFSLRREREVESARRANQYVRAIQVYYKKFGHYPGSLQQLENTNQIRFLRQEYVDPLTGKSDWRLIAPGQNKTTVKGFFGEPLQGIESQGLGSAAGMQSAGIGGPAGGAAVGVGGAGGAGAAAGFGGAGAGGATGAAGTAGGAGAAGTTDTSGLGGTAGGAGGVGNGLGTGNGPGGLGFGTGSVGPIMGIGSNATGSSILTVNEQTAYESWEFLYDPRIEILKMKAALNAGLGSASSGALGQTPGAIGQSQSGFGAGGANGTNGTSTGTNGAGAAQPGGSGTSPTQP